MSQPTDPTETAIYAAAWGARAERIHNQVASHAERGYVGHPHFREECDDAAQYALQLYRSRHQQPAPLPPEYTVPPATPEQESDARAAVATRVGSGPYGGM